MTLRIKDLEERSGQLERTGIRGLEMEVKDWKEEAGKGVVKEENKGCVHVLIGGRMEEWWLGIMIGKCCGSLDYSF